MSQRMLIVLLLALVALTTSFTTDADEHKPLGHHPHKPPVGHGPPNLEENLEEFNRGKPPKRPVYPPKYKPPHKDEPFPEDHGGKPPKEDKAPHKEVPRHGLFPGHPHEFDDIEGSDGRKPPYKPPHKPPTDN